MSDDPKETLGCEGVGLMNTKIDALSYANAKGTLRYIVTVVLLRYLHSQNLFRTLDM